MPVVQHFPLFSEEAQTGFEPVNQGVADPRLTTWLLRLTYEAPCGCIEPHLCDVEIFYSDIF